MICTRHSTRNCRQPACVTERRSRAGRSHSGTDIAYDTTVYGASYDTGGNYSNDYGSSSSSGGDSSSSSCDSAGSY
jgi:hypothetical protein